MEEEERGRITAYFELPDGTDLPVVNIPEGTVVENMVSELKKLANIYYDDIYLFYQGKELKSKDQILEGTYTVKTYREWDFIKGLFFTVLLFAFIFYPIHLNQPFKTKIPIILKEIFAYIFLFIVLDPPQNPFIRFQHTLIYDVLHLLLLTFKPMFLLESILYMPQFRRNDNA